MMESGIEAMFGQAFLLHVVWAIWFTHLHLPGGGAGLEVPGKLFSCKWHFCARPHGFSPSKGLAWVPSLLGDPCLVVLLKWWLVSKEHSRKG